VVQGATAGQVGAAGRQGALRMLELSQIIRWLSGILSDSTLSVAGVGKLTSRTHQVLLQGLPKKRQLIREGAAKSMPGGL
jgi:hypothetical protein